MKISDALNSAKNILQKSGVENPNLDALLLLMHVANLSKEQVIFDPNFELNPRQQDDFKRAISRRQAREPVSHIINKREFFGRDFYVDKNVLDPRPDSETLIEFALQNVSKNQDLQILELGAGSGCLVISLLCELPNAQAIAVDVSLQALEICAKNAAFHQINNRLQLQESDLWQKIAPQKFDLIISNPPYIASAQIQDLEDEVRLHEPHLALDGGEDGLDFYRKIAAKAADFLKPQGLVIVEIGFGKDKAVAEIFAVKDFKLNDSKSDLAGTIRVLRFVI